ncbi:MAG: hypothetical protein JKX90_08775 [Colwellia sp.]|nr:hypothetical protein [Colwellia sp.]
MNYVFIVILFVLSLPAYSSSDSDIWTEKFESSELLKDIAKNNYFSPPYESMSDLKYFSKYCNVFFDDIGVSKGYRKIIVRNEYLAFAAGKDSVIGDFIKKSGGPSVFYDYVTREFISLINFRESPSSLKIAKHIFSEHSHSPQMIKVESQFKKGIEKLSPKIKTKEDAIKYGTLFQSCLLVVPLASAFRETRSFEAGSVLINVIQQIKIQEFNDMKNRIDAL